jgi:hypothetical protein
MMQLPLGSGTLLLSMVYTSGTRMGVASNDPESGCFNEIPS